MNQQLFCVRCSRVFTHDCASLAQGPATFGSAGRDCGRPMEEYLKEEALKRAEQNQLNQRPTSYGTGGKAVVGESDKTGPTWASLSREAKELSKPKLTTEQIHAKLKELSRSTLDEPNYFAQEARFLIVQLPDPPRVDVVEECAKVMCASNFYSYNFDKLEDIHKAYARKAASETLRRYLELRGLPADPELEGQ